MRVRMILILMLVLAACAPAGNVATPSPDTAVTSPPEGSMPTSEPPESPFGPKPGDEQLTRGEVYLDEASLLIRESFPPQIVLVLRGNLPTPCHELRAEVAPPDPENKIEVDVYSVADPDTICTQVLEPLDEQIELGTFPSGHYAVWVNGQLAGEFDS
ncbi:MAG TPA: hypothetical protein VK900_03070 [Anaerolineales bacterium]|nr:hypothetical protein [Anaerolineales bacterium]